MALNYYTLQPDLVYLVKDHFQKGRSGRKIEYITRHHLAYIGGVKAVVDNIWNHPKYPRQASAHGVIDPKGEWGQSVWDDNTAYGNANWESNLRTIVLEHSNITGKLHGDDWHPDSWKISDETIKSGARIAAAYCLHEKLGAPKFGKNIRDHNEFTATSCPHWLSNGRRYHLPWMEEAKWFYDQLNKKLVNPDGTPIKMKFPAPEKGTMMADFDTQTTAADGTEHTYGQLLRYTDGRVFNMESETLPRLEKKLDAILDNQKKILGKGETDDAL